MAPASLAIGQVTGVTSHLDFAALPPERPQAPPAYIGPTNFTWLLRGRLGGFPRPGLVQTVEADVKGLLRLGVTDVVTLTEEWEPPVAPERCWPPC